MRPPVPASLRRCGCRSSRPSIGVCWRADRWPGTSPSAAPGCSYLRFSGAIVALALVAQATSFGSEFTLFALVILPVVLFIGLTTLVRLGGSNYHDAMCVMGMNRIRAGYLELAPDLERFFVMGVHDDMKGIGLTMAVEPGTSNLLHGFAATPAVVSVINSVLVGVIVALIALELGLSTVAALIVAVVGTLVMLATLSRYGMRQMERGAAMLRPIFPTPAGEE